MFIVTVLEGRRIRGVEQPACKEAYTLRAVKQDFLDCVINVSVMSVFLLSLDSNVGLMHDVFLSAKEWSLVMYKPYA